MVLKFLYDKFGQAYVAFVDELKRVDETQLEALGDRLDFNIAGDVRYAELPHEEAFVLYMSTKAWDYARSFNNLDDEDKHIQLLWEDRSNEEVLILYSYESELVQNVIDILQAYEEEE